MAYRYIINIPESEIDKPIYRIMSERRLFECLTNKELVLVHPSKWDDPFENYLLSSEVIDSSTGEIGTLEPMRDKVYGLCWTQHRDTDAMWRIYSSNKDGARVKTTPRKLLEALINGGGGFADITCFIGKVQYKTLKELIATLTKIDLFSSNGSGLAESLLVTIQPLPSPRFFPTGFLS